MRIATWPEQLFKPAAVLADPSRAVMLAALMDGIAMPAGELARLAGIGASAASAHLSRLIAEGFVTVEVQGRHRYYRLAGPEVAAALETMAALMPRPPARPRPRNALLGRARLCYHHLAGSLGVRLREVMLKRDWLQLDGDGCTLAMAGTVALRLLKLLPDDGRLPPRGKLCLDWTERRHHIGGALGSELARGLIEHSGWLRRSPHCRVLTPTAAGLAGLRQAFGIDLYNDNVPE